MRVRTIKPAKLGLLLFLAIAVLGGAATANPNFTVGSNPYLTVFAYPHDLLQWPDQAVVFYMNPQTLPWQGDVTDIANRPSASYTANYQNVEFATPSDYTGNASDVYSWMEVSSYAYKNRYALGGLYTTKHGKFLVELGKTATNMELTAEGVGRASETIGTSTAYHMVPFKGETNSGRDDMDLTVTFARMAFKRPVGFRLRYIRKTSEQPSGYINFTRDGQAIQSPHLTWGWATRGCNHIFGYAGINTDAFYQNSYTVYNGHQLDLQFSMEHNGNHKSGLRYRTSSQDGENYSWQYDDGSDYTGAYHGNDLWKDRLSSKLIRAYSKVTFWDLGELDMGLLFFLQYDSFSETEVNKLIESERETEEREREFVIETNPWLNYVTPKGYFDFGFLMEFSRTGMRNTRTRWNGVSGSEQYDVLWSTSPYEGWSPSWENFSQGSVWFFATGFEAYSSVSVYKRFAVQTRLMVLKKLTYTTKEYGSSDIQGSSFEFNQSHERKDSKNETWMTGSVGISHGFGPVQAFITMDLPLAYLLRQTTKLSDNSTQLFEHTQKNMWQVQQPVTTRLMVVMGLGAHPGGHGGK